MIRLLFYAAIFLLLFGLRIVKPGEWIVVRRSGKYAGFRKEGIHWVIPFVDKTIRVDLSKVSDDWTSTPEQVLETKVHQWIEKQSDR